MEMFQKFTVRHNNYLFVDLSLYKRKSQSLWGARALGPKIEHWEEKQEYS